jgi:hypothetical protein
MTDEPFLQSLITFTTATQRLFSNAEKVEREKMICRSFLRCVSINFTEDEISKGASEPIDIAFRSAAFQITEILDHGRLRSIDIQQSAQAFKQAGCAEDVLEPWKSSVPISFEDVAALVVSRLGEKSTKLGGARGCSGIDALAYINLRGRHLVLKGLSEADEKLAIVRAQGWRSASIVMLPYGIVWFATGECPEFLSRIHGSILHDDKRTDGWFEPQSTFIWSVPFPCETCPLERAS